MNLLFYLTKDHCLHQRDIDDYLNYLLSIRKADSTVYKYRHYLLIFYKWLNGRVFNQENFALFIKDLDYTPATINCCISIINGLASYLHLNIKLKHNRIVKPYCCIAQRELTKNDYDQLIKTARELKRERISCIMMVLANLGIRISELSFLSVETLNSGKLIVTNKGKTRDVPLPKKLTAILKRYARNCNITSGPLFVGKDNRPLSRKKIWAELKYVSKKANVLKTKVFPHNFRHLFARQHYKYNHDIYTLSLLLGHSSTKTTEGYLIKSSFEFDRSLRKMHLLDQFE